MLENAITRSPVATQTDPDTHAECLGFIRTAIASNDRQTALDIKNVLADVCQRGHADRSQIWAELTPIERQQFQELLAPPPLARDFARRIEEAIGYQSSAVASAIDGNLEDAIDAGELTSAELLAVVGEAQFAEFKRFVSSPVPVGNPKSKI